MLRSLKFQLPGALTTSAPVCSPACQTLNTAPSGSAKIAIRPASKMSNGSVTTVPPFARTRSTASSALSTAMYVIHVTGPSPIAEPTARHAAAVDRRLEVPAVGVRRHLVFELPVEEVAVEGGGRRGVRLRGVDPARHAGGISIAMWA